MTDTIAAIATAGGIGSIAIVRLSGPDAPAIARHIAPRASLRPRLADLAPFFDREGNMIDQGIILYFQAPHSYTGEDVIEFQCHGGRIVAQEILDATIAHGARLAEPGAFSKRAFLHGKIDFSEAEAVAKIIEAQSSDAARILVRQLRGELGEFVATVRTELLRALAHSEVMIDYAEAVPDTLIAALHKQLDTLSQRMEHIVAGSRRRRGVFEGFRVAIIGKPNVGKSSLLNALLDDDRAIVSDLAGTTRDTVEASVRIGAHLIRLIDTAGIRHADDTIEQIGVQRALRSVEEADVVIALFDGSRPFDAEDDRILDLIEAHPDKTAIAACNKSDLPRALTSTRLDALSPIAISAVRHFEHLIGTLEKRLDAVGYSDDILLTTARQIDAVIACQDAIEAAKIPLFDGELELFSYHLRDAIAHIGTITHPYDNDEVLDKMFGTFCLGK